MIFVRKLGGGVCWKYFVLNGRWKDQEGEQDEQKDAEDGYEGNFRGFFHAKLDF